MTSLLNQDRAVNMRVGTDVRGEKRREEDKRREEKRRGEER
jgi:hypothetical protein